MSSTAANIRWSDQELTMRDFVDDYRDSLPVILLTRTGYSGSDDDIHQIGAGEVYWVYEIQRQRRLVARQKAQHLFLSIPSDYPLNVQVFKNGKLGSSKSVKDLSKELVEGGNPIEIQFEKNQSVSFQVGADVASATQFGTLSVEDTYEEKYLLAYTIHSGEIFAKTVGLPVYMDITVSVAEGLTNGDRATFSSWMKELEKTAGRFTRTPAKMCQEIILFNEMPSSGQYEYIKPAQMANLKKTLSPLIDGKPSSPGEKPSSPGGKPAAPGKSGDLQKLNVYIACPERSPIIQTPEKLSLPPFPRRPPPSLPGQVQPASPVSSPGTVVWKTGETGPLHSAPPPIPPNRRPSVSSSPTLPYPAADPPTSNRSLDRQHPAPCPSTSQQHPDPVPAAPCFLDAYKSFDEVPADIDVSLLTVHEVSKVLRLMKLDGHCGIFESRSVDGELLLQLDESILLTDFEFSSFDAKKLMMFAKGWRPKKS